MTKEEALEKAHPDRSYMTPPMVNYATAYKAMDEYAKEMAIGFMKWYYESDWAIDDDNTFFYQGTEDIATYDQLFNHFLNET